MVTLTLKSIFNAKNVTKSCQSLGSLYLDVIYSGWLTLLFSDTAADYKNRC